MTQRTQSEWLALIQEFEHSGLSQAAFCAKRDLNAKYFSLRRNKLLATRQSSAFMAAAIPQVAQSGSVTLHYGKESLIPAQVRVTKHARQKYTCPCCEQYHVTASKPKQPIEKSIVSPGLLAHIATQKYGDALRVTLPIQPAVVFRYVPGRGKTGCHLNYSHRTLT